jgi:hypothetical protein
MEAMQIATNLRMQHGDGEAAFIEARDQCRKAQARGDGGRAKLYSTVGSTLVELGAITADRAMELIDPKVEMIDTDGTVEIDAVQIPTKIDAACDRYAGRWGLDTVKVKAEGENRVAVATNGKILAAVDCHTTRDMDLNAHRTTMPTKKTDRNVVIQYDGDDPTASQNHKAAHAITPVVYPPVGKDIFPKRDDLGQTMTFSVGQLRALLDALCPVNDPEALVTIGLNTSVNKQSAIATEHGIGAIMPYGQGRVEDQNQTRMGDWDAEVERVSGLCDQG